MSKWIKHNPETWAFEKPPAWLKEAEIVFVEKRNGEVESTSNASDFLWDDLPGNPFRVVAFRAIGPDGEDMEEPLPPPARGVFSFKDGYVKLDRLCGETRLVVCDREGVIAAHCPNILVLDEDDSGINIVPCADAARQIGFETKVSGQVLVTGL